MTADAPAEIRPFSDSTDLEWLGCGRYGAALGERYWTVGPKAHGGFLLVLLAKAALARLGEDAPGLAPDPLGVAADFLRAPDPGPVEMHTEVLKSGRTVSVVSARMEQAGKLMLSASITAGVLPTATPEWTDLPDLPAEPPAGADDAMGSPAAGLAASCDIRLDTSTVPYLRRQTGPPIVRGWARPKGEPVDALFALLAGDLLPPTVFNIGGRIDWAPSVQLTALLRAHPAPGWLRLESCTTAVHGAWFDEDVTVIDSAGRLVCQARQIALAPLGR